MDCYHCRVVQCLFVDSRVISSTSDQPKLLAGQADMYSAVNLTEHLGVMCIGAAHCFPL